MFIGDLGAEIQAIVWRSWKMSWSSPVYFPPLYIQRDSSSVYKSIRELDQVIFGRLDLYLDF